jgi:hypothetical protein
MMSPDVPLSLRENEFLATSAERIALTIPDGSLWRFRGFRAVGETWKTPPGVYRVLGVGKHVRTGQELVAHVGVSRGADLGRIYMAPLESWAKFFTPYQEESKP